MFLSGAPLVSDPQAPIFYIPNLLFLIFPMGAAFIFSSIVHSAVGGIGAFLVAVKGLKFSKKSSVFVGILYIFSARFVGFIEAGHFGLIASMAWIPFVLLAVIYLTRQASFKWSILFAISLAGLFYTHPTTFVYSALFASATFIVILLTTQNKNGWFKSCFYFTVGAGLTFGITAVALLPQLEWVPQTNRFLLVSDRDVYPKWQSIGEFLTAVLAPELGGVKNIWKLDSEKWLLIGVFPAILAMKGFLDLKRRFQLTLFLTTIAIVIVCLNNASPLYEILLDQNWYVFGRVSTRVWFVVGLIVVFLAGYGLDALLKAKKEKVAFTLVVLAAIELFVVSWVHITKPVVNDRQTAPKAILEYLSNDNGIFRVFCTTRCFSQKDIAEYGLETIEGYSTLHQKNYYQHAWQLTGTYWNYYTLTLPPIGSYKYGKLDPDYKALGEYNTKYIISPYELESDSLSHLALIDQYYIYQNNYFLPRAYLASGEEINSVEIVNYTPNSIEISLRETKQGKLILAEVYSNGWEAFTDNFRLPVMETPQAQRVIEIGNETESVNIRYRPKSLRLGLAITLGTLSFLFIWCLKRLLAKPTAPIK